MAVGFFLCVGYLAAGVGICDFRFCGRAILVVTGRHRDACLASGKPEDGGAVQGNNNACARPSPTEPCLASRGEGCVAERERDVGGGVFLSPVKDGVGGGVA